MENYWGLTFRNFMDFYHGTTIGGLKELKPFAFPNNNLKEPVVYLTINKQLALHYIKDRNESPMLNINNNGKLIFEEMFSEALEILFKGKSGYIYHCVGDYEINKNTGVLTTATSDKPVPVKDCEFIEDVYEKILEYGKYGMFYREKYEELPEWRHYIIRGWVMKWIKEGNWLNNPESNDFKKFNERWPRYLEEALILSKYDLL